MNIVVEETSGLLLRGSLLIVQIWLFKLQDYIGIYMLTHTHAHLHAYIFKDYFSNTVKLVHSDTVTKVEIAVKRAGFHFYKPPKKVFNEGAAKVHGSYSTVVCKVVALSGANSYSASNRSEIIVKQRSFLHNSHNYCKDGHNISISFSVIEVTRNHTLKQLMQFQQTPNNDRS